MTNSDSSAPPYPEVQARNFANITNFRLREIAERNSIRQEAGLPLLSVPKELRRMKEAADAEKFRAFVEANRKNVYAKMLGRVRRRCGEPNWTPNGVLSGGAVARVDNSALTELVITDSILATDATSDSSRIRILPVAPLIGEAVRRIADESSVSSLFD